MNPHDEPDEDRKSQGRRGGRPPQPPGKSTPQFGDDDSERERRMRAMFEFEQAGKHSDRLVEVLGYLRESRLQVAINKREADLDASVVTLGKGPLLMPQFGQLLAKRHLESVLRYRVAYPRIETGNSDVREEAQRILNELKHD